MRLANRGRVRSLNRTVTVEHSGLRYQYRRRGYMMKLSVSYKGHHTVRLGAKPKFYYVHALVLKAFAGPRPPGAISRHLNGRPTDNRIKNLVWGTHSENGLDRRKHGGTRGMKLTDAMVRAIKRKLRNYKRGMSAELAVKYGVSRTHITNIKLGKRVSSVQTL